MKLVRLLRPTISAVSHAFSVLVLLTLLPGLPPHDKFTPLNIVKQIPLVGKCTPQYLLDKAELLVGPNHIVRPESIVVQGMTLYTGDETGRVIQIDDADDGVEVTTLGVLGPACDGPWNVDCSRPCGMRMDPMGKLVFADMNLGIISFDLKARRAESLVQIQHANDLDIADDGTIYFSVISSEVGSWSNSSRTLLQHLLKPSGKLLKFDPRTKVVTTILRNLSFPNGVQLSENEDFILVNEAPLERVVRFYLKGPKAGIRDIFIRGLPGVGENIRPNGKGGFFIPHFMGRIPLIKLVGRYPLMQKMFSRIQWLLSKTVDLFQDLNLGNNVIPQHIKCYLTFYGPLGLDLTAKAKILEVDEEGLIIRVLAAKDKDILGNTQISLGQKYAYLVSYAWSKIWKIPLSDLL